MGTTNLLLIGCGTIGSLRAEIAATNPAVGTIHLVDVRAEAAETLASRLPRAVVNPTVEAALAVGDLSGVIVSTTEFEHVAAVESAIERGVPTLVEKPLAHEPAAARRIADRADAAGVPLYVGYSQRFRRRYLSAKEIVRTGTLGRLTGATSTFFATQAIARKILARSPAATPATAVATYLVDLLLWYAEPALPRRVVARSTFGSVGGRVPEAPATTWAFIEMDDGTVLNVGTGWDFPPNHPAYNATLSLDLFGTDGFLSVDDTHKDVMVTTTRGVTAPYTPEVVVTTAFVGSHAPGDIVAGRLWGPIRAETNEFIASIARGVPSHLLSPGGHAADVVQVTSAINVSASRDGEPVELEVTRPEGRAHVVFSEGAAQ